MAPSGVHALTLICEPAHGQMVYAANAIVAEITIQYNPDDFLLNIAALMSFAEKKKQRQQQRNLPDKIWPTNKIDIYGISDRCDGYCHQATAILCPANCAHNIARMPSAPLNIRTSRSPSLAIGDDANMQICASGDCFIFSILIMTLRAMHTGRSRRAVEVISNSNATECDWALRALIESCPFYYSLPSRALSHPPSRIRLPPVSPSSMG